MLLSGKTIVVTGANSGIGRAIALATAGEGADVVVDYVADREAADEVVATIERAGGSAIAVDADVSELVGVVRIIGAAVDRFGRLDVLVNNAGIGSDTSILDTTEQDYDRVLAVNLKGAFFATQIAAKRFIEQGGGGLVVNISSVHEDWPMPGNVPYCLSKGGMRMLARTAGVELASYGIRVINLCPGAVATPINEETLEDPAKRERLVEAIPLGRIAQPEDIAEVAVMLASGRGDYMTATSVFVDGGLMQRGIGL